MKETTFITYDTMILASEKLFGHTIAGSGITIDTYIVYCSILLHIIILDQVNDNSVQNT